MRGSTDIAQHGHSEDCGRDGNDGTDDGGYLHSLDEGARARRAAVQHRVPRVAKVRMRYIILYYSDDFYPEEGIVGNKQCLNSNGKIKQINPLFSKTLQRHLLTVSLLFFGYRTLAKVHRNRISGHGIWTFSTSISR